MACIFSLAIIYSFIPLAYVFSNYRWHVYSSLMAYLFTLCIDCILLNHNLLSCSFAILLSLPFSTLYIHFIFFVITVLTVQFGITVLTVQMAYSFVIDGIFTHTFKLWHIYSYLLIIAISVNILFICHLFICHSISLPLPFLKLCIKIWHIQLKQLQMA